MKQVIRAVAVMTAFLSFSVVLFAQKPQGQTDWHEKMKAEKVGILTTAMELTAEEAQSFWPVYNKLDEQKTRYMMESRSAYRDLNAALKDGKSDEEVAELLARYTSAQLAAADFDATCMSEYSRVLPARKVAKLIVAEEKFRRLQFQRFQGQGNGPGRGQRPADRPQQGNE